MAKRRTAAGQERMRIISQLAKKEKETTISAEMKIGIFIKPSARMVHNLRIYFNTLRLCK